MELSLAVTHSLTDLIRRCSVYCTEPFRIPLAGMVTTCCFDKTGTLTSDDVQFLGVILPIHMDDSDQDSGVASPSLNPKTIEPISNVSDLPVEVQRIIIACQGLSLASDKSSRDFTELIGDPMEKAVFKASGWKMISDNTVAPPVHENRIRPMLIKYRYIFTSQLKRMSVIVDIGGDRLRILTKGAPETIKTLLTHNSIPKHYDEFYQQQMRSGRRVLAMASGDLGSANKPLTDFSKSRSVLEKQLIFAGFLIFDSPLKADSTKVIKHLRQAGLETAMITGDSLLTAVEVARRVGLVDKQTTIYELCEFNQRNNSPETSFGLFPVTRADGGFPLELCIPLSSLHFLKDSCVCTTGEILTRLVGSLVEMDHKMTLLHPGALKVLEQLVPYITIFARHVSHCKLGNS